MFHEMTLKLYFMKCSERNISQCILHLSIHYHQFGCRQKAKTDEAYQPQLFQGHIKNVIYVFHGNWDSFDMIFITAKNI